MKSERRMTPLQEAFVVALPKVDWVGTDAVIKAGFQVSKRKSAAEIASQLLKKTQVRAAVDRMMKERLQRAGIYAERVLTRMAQLAFADIRRIFDPNGDLLPPKDWPEDVFPAIAGVETLEEYKGTGKNRKYIGRSRKIRLWDPNPSLTNLAKYLGLFPSEKTTTEEVGAQRPLSDMEVSAKIVLLVQLAIKKQQERERQKLEGGS